MFKPAKRKVLTGSQAVERMEAEAKAELPYASAEASDALEGLMEQIRNPNASNAQVDSSAKEFHAANERLTGVYNVVSFFVFLDDQSHYGSVEPAVQP